MNNLCKQKYDYFHCCKMEDNEEMIGLEKINDNYEDYLGSIIGQFDFDFKSLKKATKFLSQQYSSIHPVKRLFAWLVALNILPPKREKWEDRVNNLIDEYIFTMQANLLDSSDNPLSTLSEELQAIIRVDLQRSFSWFQEMCRSLEIPMQYTEKSDFIGHRIFAILSHAVPTFKYIQAYDRYFYVCHMLTLKFTSVYNLDMTVAEALSYFLTKSIVNISIVSKLTDNISFAERHFQSVDRLASQLCPDAVKFMDGITALQWALPWEAPLFADCHPARGILQIWDAIISRRGETEKLLAALSVAHLMQVPIERDMVVAVQQFNAFDSISAVSTALSLLGAKQRYSPAAVIVAIVVLIACLVLSRFIFQ